MFVVRPWFMYFVSDHLGYLVYYKRKISENRILLDALLFIKELVSQMMKS